MDIIIQFKQRTETVATKKYSSEVMVIPRIGEKVKSKINGIYTFQGTVIAVEHLLDREPKEIWVIVECTD